MEKDNANKLKSTRMRRYKEEHHKDYPFTHLQKAI